MINIKITLKRIIVPLMLVLTLCLFAACGSEGEEDSAAAQAYQEKDEVSKTVRVITSSDVLYNMDVLKGLGDKYELTQKKTEAEAIKLVKSGEADFAVLTPTGAASLYMSSKDIKVISPVFAGGFRVVGDKYNVYLAGSSSNSKKTAPTPATLRFCTVNMCDGSGFMRALVAAEARLAGTSLSTYIQPDTDSLENVVGAYNQVAAVNLSDRANSTEKLNGMTVLFDLDAYWESKTGGSIPAAVLIVSNDFLEERGDELQAVIRDYEEAMEKADTSFPAGRLVFYGESNRGSEILKDFYSRLYNTANDKAKIPDKDFYYR